MPCAVVFSFVLSWSVSKRWTILTCQFAVLKCAVVVNSPWFDHAMTRIHDRIFVRIRPHTAVVFGWDPWDKQHSILGKVARSGSFKNFARGSRLFSQIIRGARTMFNQRTMLNNTELCFSCSPACFCTSMAKSCIIVFSDDSNGGCSHWFLSALFESPFAKDVESCLKRLYLYGASLTSEVKAVKTQGQMPLKRKL